MSHTDDKGLILLKDDADRELRALKKDNARLREALADAQGLNEGLQKDKDDAHRLVQMMLSRIPGRTLLLTPRDMTEYDPRRWFVERTPTVTGAIQYKLREK